MAYLKVDTIVLPPETGNTVSYPVAIASLGLTLVNDEWLLVFIACPNTNGTLSHTGTGWSEVAELDITSGSRMAVYKCKVAGGTVADLTVSISTGTGMWHGFLVQVPDADATDCISGTPSTTDGGNVVSMTPTSYTPADNDCLVFYFGAARNGGSIRFLSSDVVCEALNDISNSSGIYGGICLGTRQQGTAEAASKVMYGSDTQRMGTIIVAIKNKTSGAKAADCRAGITKLAWMGNFGAAHEGLSAVVAATALVANRPYEIKTVGTTDFTLIGASSNTIGVRFIATGAGTGTGDTYAAFGAPSTFCSAWPSGNINGVTADASAAAASVASSYWGYLTRLTSTTNTAGAWCGGWIPTPSTFDLTGKLLSIEFDITLNDYFTLTQGVCIALGDSASASTGNAVVYQIAPKSFIKAATLYTAVVAIGTGTTIQTVGSINLATINKIGFFVHRGASNASARYLNIKNILIHSSSTMVGGNVNRPLDIKYLNTALNGWGYRGICDRQGDAVMVKTPIQFGDGTITTYVNTSGTLLNTPDEYSTITQPFSNIPASTFTVGMYTSASDTMKFVASSCASGRLQNFTINASSSASASYDFTGEAFGKWNMTWATNVPVSGATYSGCDTVAFKGADVTSCTVTACDNNISGTTGAACSFDANGVVVTNSTISCVQADGTSTGYHVALGASLTSITLNGVTLSGTATTDKIYSALASGTLTIYVDGTGSALVDSDVTFVGGSTAVASVVSSTAITFTGLVAGMKVKVFTTTTTTEVFGVTSSGTSEVWSGASGTFDYTIQKAGYKPIRATGEVVSGSRTITVSPEVDRAYAASSGLTLSTNCYATVGTKKFGLTTTSTLQNFYSYMIEQWIALGDGGETFANVAFPIQPNGPNSFSFLSGWEWDLATYSASITNLSRDGLRYVNTSGTTTASWAAILSSGVPSGARVRYQQSDGGTTQQAAVTSGNMDELVQVYGDATHGNFNYTGYLVLKAQEMGYDQVESDAVSLYGTLEDQLYVIGLAPTANTVATGNPSLANPPAITDHAGSPVTWQSKDWSITITDSAAGNTGTGIMRWLRYYFETGGTFQGTDAFNWHDLVQQNGDDFKTVRGKLYGDTGATLKGVRVVMNDGTTVHPDFTLLTADDGTTYAPPVVADVSITGMPTATGASTRLQIINATAESAAAWVANTAYATGDIVKRTTGFGSEETAGLYFRATTGGTSDSLEPTWDTTVGNPTTDGSVTWTTYAILFYHADPLTSSYITTYVDGEEFLAGESVEIRFAEMDAGTSFKTYDTTTIASASGFSVSVAEEADDVYATYGLDGSTYDSTFSPNFTADYIVLDTNTDFLGASSFSYYCYILTTDQGMYEFWGGVTAIDPGNIRINTAILNLYFDCSSGFVKQTDSVRVYRDDGVRPAIDPVTAVGGGIEINWRTPVNVISTGGSALTPTESAYLLALPVATANASAVRTELTTELADIVTTRKLTENDRILGLDGTITVKDDNGAAYKSGLAYKDTGTAEPYDGTGAVHHTSRLT